MGQSRAAGDSTVTITGAERQLQADAEAQWVRSPVAGLVSDISVTGVTPRVVTLEVMIREGREQVSLPLGSAVSR